jgi:hypothetical protein
MLSSVVDNGDMESPPTLFGVVLRVPSSTTDHERVEYLRRDIDVTTVCELPLLDIAFNRRHVEGPSPVTRGIVGVGGGALVFGHHLGALLTDVKVPTVGKRKLNRFSTDAFHLKSPPGLNLVIPTSHLVASGIIVFVDEHASTVDEADLDKLAVHGVDSEKRGFDFHLLFVLVVRLVL